MLPTAVALMLAMPGAADAQQGIGGAQDIGYARQRIASGGIPAVPDFSLEGLFREHDIQPPSAACDARVCLSLGYGIAQDEKTPSLIAHVGVDSGIDPEDFKRGNLQLAIVVDKSGSMDGESMDAMKSALRSLLKRLGPEDELTLVEFNNEARLILSPTKTTDVRSISGAIERLTADGGTNIEAGLKIGYRELAALPTRENTSKRLMLFTDAMPNVGGTDSGSFGSLTRRYAREGIGLTVFGVGVNFGHDLVYNITQLRGGSAYYLDTPEKIAQVFEKEFDRLVTPLAYDLKVKVATPPGFRLVDVYGLPTWRPGSADAELEIPTVFLSGNRSAILLRYEPISGGKFTIDEGATVLSGSVAYANPDGSGYFREMTAVNDHGGPLTSDAPFYTHKGVRTAIALMNVYFGLRDGIARYHEGDPTGAVRVVRRAKVFVEGENSVLADSAITAKVALLTKLEENIGSVTVASGAVPTAP